ncbi:hypothetical protein TNCV_3028881 [Trichonephila clavipes]|nr:hypothetical protein TNCV_3028881 [Trichonephila clavipes]
MDNGATRWVRSTPSFAPACSDDKSTSQLLVFVQHVDQFLLRIICNPYRLLYFSLSLRSNSETWSKDARCLPRGIDKQRTQKKKKSHEKTIAALQIVNLFSLYIALAGGATVTRNVRLRCNSNDLCIFNRDVSVTWFACFLQGIAFCMASSG